MMFKRKLLQRLAFTLYIFVILCSVIEVWNIIFDYYGYLERIMNYNKLYFIGLHILIIMVIVEELMSLIKKESKKP